jgi:hypothetical protein
MLEDVSDHGESVLEARRENYAEAALACICSTP